MDIKVESEKGRMICHGCLSGDRKLCCVSEEMNDLFCILRNDKFIDRQINLELCWECIALLAKVKMLQTRIQTAQCFFMNHCNMDAIPNLVSLSSLNETHLKMYNYEFNEQVNYLPNHFNILNDKRKEIVDRDEMKDITTGDLFSDIKIEDSNIKEEDNNIKEEEYEDNDDCNDSDYFEPEPKVEKEENVINRNTSINDKKRYAKYAIVTKRYELSDRTYMNFAEPVILDKLEYENVWKREKKHYNYHRLPLKCEVCKEGYIKKLDLQRHQIFCHGDKVKFPFKCAGCRTKMTSLDHMDEHWSKIHSKPYKCTICSEIHRNMKRIKEHISAKHHTSYTCKECGTVCCSLDEFRTHYRATHKTFICDYCNLKCTKKDSLVNHIRCVHIPAYCSICDRKFAHLKSFRYHYKTTHPELISVDAPKELSYCVECDKQFPSVAKFKQHLTSTVKHTKPKKERVPCPECGKVFKKRTCMNNHYKLTHLKVTKHYCEQCDKYFSTGFGLRRHVERVHDKVPLPKDKMCDICGRGFAVNRILVNHRRTHTGERPFQCKFCPAAFAQKSAMTSHQKSQHKNLDIPC